jgi:hypothetical protein
MSRTIHNLPPTPAFRDERPDSPISEIALRVVVECPGWSFYVAGTATLITGYLAITARHVLDDVVKRFGANAVAPKQLAIESYEIKLWQVLPGPIYRVWRVLTAWTTGTDIAILHLGLDGTTTSDEKINWRRPRLRLEPPSVGQEVIAFGYRDGKINVTETADGTHHIELNDRPTTSIGKIKHIHPRGRDSVMLPFPCFEIEARFDGGMSGGLVVDERGAICGLVCSNFAHDSPDELPISYAASLRPILSTMISANRGSKYPPGVAYPVIDLVVDGLIAVS